MNKQLAFKRYLELLSDLHRFSSVLDDLPATCMLLGRCHGFSDALYLAGVIDGVEAARFQYLAYNAHQFARRAA